MLRVFGLRFAEKPCNFLLAFSTVYVYAEFFDECDSFMLLLCFGANSNGAEKHKNIYLNV